MRLPPVLLPSAFHRLAGVLGISLLSLLCLGGCVTTPKQTEGRAFESRYEGFQYCGIDAVRQSRQASCGAAALTSVLNYWKEEEGVRYTEPELIKKYPAKSSEGYPILQLREMAMYEGIAAFALTMDTNSWEQLSDHVKNGRPVICAVRLPRGKYFGKSLPLVETLDRRSVMSTGNEWLSHYVVVMGRTNDEVLLMDPKHGIVRLDRDQFLHFWSLEDHAALVCSSV